jgi:methylmalonyl-CoA/ethylmalonyl-CoA epimerase
MQHREEARMAKIRHIAIVVPDPEAARQFFEQALGLTLAGTARRGLYLTDGTINVALLKQEHPDEKLGIAHFGVWVEDLDDAEKRIAAAGGSYLTGRPTSPNSFYEAKFRSPSGQVFDVTHNGWAGAVRDVVPAKQG